LSLSALSVASEPPVKVSSLDTSVPAQAGGLSACISSKWPRSTSNMTGPVRSPSKTSTVPMRPSTSTVHRGLVRESATLVNGKLVRGAPKSHRSRTVVIPTFLVDEMAPMLSGNGLVFTSPSGQPLRSPNFLRRVLAARR